MTFKRILIAVDDSVYGAHAANTGIAMAAAMGAEVAFVSVVDPSFVAGNSDSGVPADQLLASAEREAKALLVAYRERAKTSPPALEFLERGKPAVKIVAVAKAWPADMIVIGTHGRGTVGRLLLGSVAEGVLHHAHCPVVIVRGEL